MKYIKARELALQKHRGQLDDTGKPYILHPIQVSEILLKVTNDIDIVCAGLLHDTLEDTDCTEEEILEATNQRVLDLVKEVTHEGKKDSKGYYFPRLKSRDAILIKFADRLSNLSRMQSWDEKRKQQYLRKSKFWRNKV
jgi:GTP pyrophosphokinase